jgi:hypothetical protein
MHHHKLLAYFAVITKNVIDFLYYKVILHHILEHSATKRTCAVLCDKPRDLRPTSMVIYKDLTLLATYVTIYFTNT